jgi:uncharacterized protein (TIGR02145 family)
MQKPVLLLRIFFLAILITVSCDKKNPTETKPEPPPDPVTDIDGNIYQTVRIGKQVWMAENLRVSHYRNGESIPNVTWGWQNFSEGALCYYNNYVGNIPTYGFLYNGYAVIDSQNISPAGWHVPTDEEWKVLEIFLGMNQTEVDAKGYRGTDEGGKLKETGTEHWTSPNEGATNESGFTALPGGCCYTNDDFYGIGSSARFWSSTKPTKNSLWYRELSSQQSDIQRMRSSSLRVGFSIRCIRDSEGSIPPVADFSITPEMGTTLTVFTLDAGSSSDAEDPVKFLLVRWDWENDGVWDTDYSATKTATYQSTIEGIKTIKLEVKDTDGLTDSITKQVTVKIHESPIASFTISPLSGTTSTEFSFDASGCSDNKDVISQLEVHWDWENDGVWDTDYNAGKTAKHQYSTEGTKTIKLEVKDTDGLTDSTTQNIIVSNTSTGTMTDQDGNVYKTLIIGNQWWMAENLKVTHYRNGDAILKVTDDTVWENLTTSAYCAYDDNESNVNTYGYLYNFYAVDDTRKLAPEGWHIPTETEWQALIDFLGGISVAGGKLKETGTTHWTSPNDYATNESGFTALPGGRAPTCSEDFLRINFSASFWSSTETYDAALTAWGYSLFNTQNPYLPSVTGGAISPWDDAKYNGFSIRCIKD